MSRVSLNGTKPVIGLVGGIAAGKSQVARILESLRAAVIDSDRLAHAVFEEGEVKSTIRRWWGDGVLLPDGGVNRRALAEIVFDNRTELARLESLLYPRIEKRRQELMPALLADKNVRAIVLDAPKLYEAGLDRQCDVVIFVDADRNLRLARAAASRGWSEQEINRREQQQIPLDEKKANADHIMFNNSTIENLRGEVERVFTSILGSFKQS